MQTCKVGYLIGSVDKESFNRKCVHALIKLAPEQLQFHEFIARVLTVRPRGV